MAKGPRSVEEIDELITFHGLKLRELHDERKAVMEARIMAVTRLFDAGKDRGEIAKALKINPNAVNGIIWRAGRSDAGRKAVQEKLNGKDDE